MNRLPDLSVIIVSYNVAALLEECLLSVLEREPDEFLVEIIVVDNASHDGSATLVRQKFPQCRLIENKHNYGFPRGCNQGLKVAKGRYLFFLNPDARLEPDALRKLVIFMENHPQAGIGGPQLRYPDGSLQPNRRRFPSRRLAFIESTILQRYAPFKNLKALRHFYCEDRPADQTQEVDWLVGAAFLVRRAVTNQIGGLDERFFMYSEELDFCHRAKTQGWECWYLPEAVVTHQEGRSSAQDLPQRHINFQTSKVSYYRKHSGWLYAEILRLFLLATYLFQFLEESAKLLLRHKPSLRRERLSLIRQVLASGLRPYHSPYPPSAAELEVCLISAEYPPQPGGVGDYTDRLAETLAELCGVQVLTGLETSPAGRSAGRSAERPFTILRRKSNKWNWACLPEIAQFLERRPTGAVIIQYQTGAYRMHPAINFLPLYLRWRLGPNCPVVATTFHDLLLPYLFPKAGPVRRWVNQLLLRSSDRAIVTNPEDYQTALEWGAAPEKLSLIPIGSNITPVTSTTKTRAEVRQGWGLTEKEFVIGYFGLLNRSKGVDTLLESLAQLRDEPGGEKWRLVIIGGEIGQTDPTNQPYAYEIERLITRLKLEKIIIRTGHLSNPATSQAFSGLDVVALPFRDGASFRRGSLLAPLVHGLPVVTTASPHLTSPNSPLEKKYANIRAKLQLLSGKTVYLVEPENSQALALALRHLQSNPELLTALAQNALELSQHFGWDAIANDLLKVLLGGRVSTLAEVQRQTVGSEGRQN
ncbi:MAG: glycosyltransferase [Chloroflexi bacterium]|nr:glycosyltransferase [Chloroflexota bacterium]